jgi:glycosyltransferase involved in cell wall biosynthesis
MRIALISYEFAGNADTGGIGTYMRNAARMLVQRGHDVEVFTGGVPSSHEADSNLRVHGVARSHADFAEAIVVPFTERHRAAPFDVAEAPEYRADAAAVARAFPALPLVVKLHTPSVLVSLINMQPLSPVAKARFIGGSLIRGRLPQPYWSYNRAADYELEHVRRATVVAAPCRAIVSALAPLWDLRLDDVDIVPNVFSPVPALLELDPASRTNVVSFFGRQEPRKGIWHFVQAIPQILRRFPAAQFRIIGRPADGAMAARLREYLAPFARCVEIVPGVAYDEMPRYYGATDICVAPSLWENFPNVCLEGMAAGRGVIGSTAGGMSEIIADGETGLLVPPGSAEAIAEAVVGLLDNPDRRIAMGTAARRHVQDAYGVQAVAPLQEALYRKAIAKRGERAMRQLSAAGAA